MSQADLNALERNVEQARARFANDLARLRSPVNLARFKDDLWAEARETKDEWVEKTKEAAKDGAQRVLTQLTERAAANPAAAMGRAETRGVGRLACDVVRAARASVDRADSGDRADGRGRCDAWAGRD